MEKNVKMINTVCWGEFSVKDLFEIHPTASYGLANALLLDDGENPVVVNSAFNNGIGGMSSYATTEKGNIITFSDTVDANTIFYQELPFIGYSHVQGMYPIGKYEKYWSSNTMKFFVSVFRKAAFTKGFDYGNKFRRDIALNLKVKLPIDRNGNPNWSYMEKYMDETKTAAISYLKKLQNIISSPSSTINITGFKRFHLYDLFTIEPGSKLDRVKMSKNNPSINFVGRANANNGVTDVVDAIKDIEPYEAGNLTVSLGGEYLGSCFVQDKAFYTSQNVNVLIPKNSNMSFYSKQYICSMVFKEGRTFYKAFIDELNRHMKTDFTIALPVDDNGNPNWLYMDNYMKTIHEKAKIRIMNFVEYK